MMLTQKLSYHDVDDIEAFCRDVLNQHLAYGARKADGTSTGPSTLSAADFDDCLTDLIGASYVASQRFRTKDDGRGTNRFSGYLVWKLHKEIIDWKRRRWRPTRGLDQKILEIPFDDDLGYTLDREIVGINPDTLTPRARNAYQRVCYPMALAGVEPAHFARATRQNPFWVINALRIVQLELEQQGIAPSVIRKSTHEVPNMRPEVVAQEAAA